MQQRTFWFSVLVLGMLSAPLGCSSDDGTTPDETGPVEVKVDTFNLALAGAFIPNIDARRAPLADGIAKADSDIMCLQEVWEQTDKDMITAKAKDSFPYIVSFKHDLDTKVDDPADQEGNVPPAPTTPPCADAEVKDTFEAVIQCIQDKCNTKPGDPNGYTTSTACVEKECIAEAMGLLANEKTLRCYGCTATNLPTEKLSDIKNICETNKNAGLAFRGQSGVMILSKYPLSNQQAWVLPGTWNRRVIINATATLPNGAEVDVYCNHLTPIFDSAAFPYTGAYGQGKTNSEGWAAEQLLQAQKLIDYVKKHGEGRRAVVLGDLNAAYEFKDGDKTVLYGEGAATLDLLGTTFQEVVPSGFTPICTYCDTNGNNDTSKSEWIDHIFGYNLGKDAAVSLQRTFDEDIVDGTVIESDGSTHPGKVPLSDHYGLRAVIRVEP